MTMSKRWFNGSKAMAAMKTKQQCLGRVSEYVNSVFFCLVQNEK